MKQNLVEAALIHPDSIYLFNDEESLTYSQINNFCSYSNNIIQDKHSIIGLIFKSKIKSIVGIWSCIYSNNVYFPINDKSGEDRLNQSFHYSNAFLTDDVQFIFSLYPQLREMEVKEILFGNLKLFYVNQSTSQKKISNDDSLYLLQTSGSTGTPKLVLHSSLSANLFINWCYKTLETKSDDIFLSISPIHFDMSLLDIFLPTLTYSKVYIPNQSTFYFANDFLKAIKKSQTSILYATPSLISNLLKVGSSDAIKLKHLILAGEDISNSLHLQIKKSISFEKYFNFYGPTETNVCCYKDLSNSNEVLIGEALPYCEVRLTDSSEIIVRGPNVAQKYLGSSIEQDLVEIDGEPFYLTRDLAQHSIHGIKFVKRNDLQYKISGNRFSLEELDIKIKKFNSEINFKSVFYNNDIYVLIFDQFNLEQHNDFKKFLRSCLPTFLMPRKIIILKDEDCLPLNASYKISVKDIIEKYLNNDDAD